jgi:hypothetical protein
MRGMIQQRALVMVLVAALLVALSPPANAAATNQISGTAFLEESPCAVRRTSRRVQQLSPCCDAGKPQWLLANAYRHCKNDGGGRVLGER